MENLNYQKIKYVGYFKINKIVHSLNIMVNKGQSAVTTEFW